MYNPVHTPDSSLKDFTCIPKPFPPYGEHLAHRGNQAVHQLDGCVCNHRHVLDKGLRDHQHLSLIHI